MVILILKNEKGLGETEKFLMNIIIFRFYYNFFKYLPILLARIPICMSQ